MSTVAFVEGYVRVVLTSEDGLEENDVISTAADPCSEDTLLLVQLGQCVDPLRQDYVEVSLSQRR